MKWLAAAALIFAAPAVPVSPSSPEAAQEWVNPAIRATEEHSARVEVIEAPTAISVHDPLHLRLRVTNLSDETLHNLTVVPRRAPAVGSVAEQRYAAVAGVGEYQVVGGQVDVDKQLPPGESTELSLDFGAGELGAGIGTYPMMLQLIDGTGTTYDTDRFHLSVRGARRDEPAEITALYPVSAQIDIVPGETGEAPETPPLVLASEDLAEQLAPGGRLTRLVDQYLAQDPAVGYASCMALDPALVDTVDRMSRGYTVAAERTPVVEEPKRLRDSWGSVKEESTVGAGAQDAAAWLAKVRKVSETGCTVAMPWANADPSAVARTGDEWLMREAVERGPFVLQRVLGTTGTLNAVVPGTGYVADGTAPALGWADHTRSTIATEGMQASWERSLTHGAPEDATLENSLDRREMAAVAGAPQPEATVRVLAAGSTGWIAPGVMQVGYQDSLATVLAATGEHPETTATSDPNLRFDYAIDSKVARDVSASAAVRLAAQTSDDPVMVVPPALWDPETAAAVLGAISETLASDVAVPVPLERYLQAGGEPIGAPEVSDPAAFSDAEVLQVTQQAAFIGDLSALMIPDPAIALTRYGFTLPLRRDLLTALSVGHRRALSLYDASVTATSSRLAGSRDTLGALQSSVTLIPPGNVYTRTSPSSPLLIVAQNGLPLPVEAEIRYTGPEGARLNVPGTLKIPARGSVTVQMTADIESAADLQLYLAGSNGQPISRPVDISVRTTNGWVVAGLLGFVGVLFFNRVRKSIGVKRDRA